MQIQLYSSAVKKTATLKAQLHCEIHQYRRQYRRLPNQEGYEGEGALRCIKCITTISADSFTLLSR